MGTLAVSSGRTGCHPMPADYGPVSTGHLRTFWPFTRSLSWPFPGSGVLAVLRHLRCFTVFSATSRTFRPFSAYPNVLFEVAFPAAGSVSTNQLRTLLAAFNGLYTGIYDALLDIHGRFANFNRTGRPLFTCPVPSGQNSCNRCFTAF